MSQWRRCGTAAIAHREHMVRPGIERDRSREIQCLEILLDLKTCRAVLLGDGYRAVALCAVGFHRRRADYGGGNATRFFTSPPIDP